MAAWFALYATAVSAQGTPSLPGGAEPTGGRLDFIKALGQGAERMSADEVAATAVRTAPSVARARAAADEARQAAAQGMVSLYPRLELIGQYRRLSRPPLVVYPLPPGLISGIRAVAFPRPLMDQYLFQARISYPVSDLFLTILPRHRAAKDNARAQTLSARSASFDVDLAAREAFYNYARARAAQLVARFGVSEAEAQLNDVALLVKTGGQPRVEQMRAEANLSAARVAVARADGSAAVARSALCALMHREDEAEIAVDEDLTRLLPMMVEDKEQLLREALKHRSELQALRIVEGAQQRVIRASQAEKLPKITIAASAEDGNPNPRAALFRREWTATWEALAMISWSPNDAATGHTRAAQVEAQRAQTLADIAAIEDALRREVSQAYEDYKAAHEAMTAALSGIVAAEESYRVRRAQLREDAAIATEVIIAEGDLVRARLDLVNAAIDLRIARARLDRAMERGDPG